MTKSSCCKVAVVGAGRWGKNIISTFAKLGVLTAIVETDVSRGHTLALEHSVDYFANYEDILKSDITAIAIATPVMTHFTLAKKALLAGKDVFIEKPMTTEVIEAEELIELAQKKGCILMVGHLLLYQPGIQFIKKFLQGGQLGALYSLRQVRRSLGTIRKEENVLYSLGVHDLAVLNYLIDEPLYCVAVTAQKIISDEIEDDMTIHLRYASGIQANLHLSWLWPIKDRQLMILGEKGALHFDELQQQVIFYRNFGNKDATVSQLGHEIIFSDNTPPLTLELQHFIDCVKNRSKPNSCGLQGKSVVKLMEEIMQSHEMSYAE